MRSLVTVCFITVVLASGCELNASGIQETSRSEDSAEPTPVAIPQASPTPISSPSPTVVPSPSPTGSSTPAPAPSPSPSVVPSPSPTGSSAPSPVPSPSPMPSPTTAPSPTPQVWLIDFGKSATPTAANYNNLSESLSGGGTLSSLIDSNGSPTSMTLTVKRSFVPNDANSTGSTAPDPSLDFPVSATRDNYYGNNSHPQAQIEFSGLDPAAHYDFVIFASRMNVTDNRQTSYQLTGAAPLSAVNLDVSNNDSNAARVSGVQPASDGTLLMTVGKGPQSTVSDGSYYLGAIRITSNDASAGGNIAPTVNAGTDRTIQLPTDHLTLTANATDLDGSIASCAWTKVSGGAATLSGSSTGTLAVSGLVAGTYVFRVTVSDDDGATASDDVQITVAAAPSPSPTPSSSPGEIPSNDGNHGTVSYFVLGSTGASMGFTEYLPYGYDPSSNQKWPLILFLSGMGQLGSGATVAKLQNMEIDGPLKIIKNEQKDFPAVIIYPQNPVGWDAVELNAFLDFLFARYPSIDRDRVYLTGLSMGAQGVWNFSTHYPERFAAIVPIANNMDWSAYKASDAAMANVAIWAFHNRHDPTAWYNASTNSVWGTARFVFSQIAYTIPADTETSVMSMDLDAASKTFVWSYGMSYPTPSGGYEFHFTSYPASTHDAWTQTYANPMVWQWLFSQRRH